MISEERRQAALDAMGILDTPPDERVERVVRLAQDLFRVPMVSVSLIDRDRQWRKAQIGLGGNEAPRKDSFCDATVRRDAPLIVEDATTLPEFADNPFVAGDPHLRFYAGHPLHAPGGEPVGTLCIVDTTPREFSERDRELLGELALWVQTELDHDQEMDNAEVVQRAMISRDTPEFPGYTIAAALIPKGRMSGDYYDLTVIDGRLRITVVDVMGKGLGPALVASGIRGSLRTGPQRPLTDALTEVDCLLDDTVGELGLFATAAHADLDPVTGEIELVDAGHGLSFIVSPDGTWLQLRSTQLPLGMGEPEGRTSTFAELQPGDTFLCCSDGLLDVLDPDDPFSQVERAINTLGPEGSVQAAIRLATTDKRATDDVTVIAIRRDQ